ncbi:alpha/beta-hydrolase [Clavulina sp. PMI_390]|nr:alpha/beta-hydrolase [Clavulina sp. PMI_390]
MTLVNLAKASWDAYYPSPNDRNWYDLNGTSWVSSWDLTSRFGWRPGEDGFRGHLFLSSDRQHGIVVFKGTTVFQFGFDPNLDSSKRDRLNNNLLFSCCCATVPWRIETSHPCQCNAGRGKCCSSCLTESLENKDTYYKNAEMVVNYFQHKYPTTNFWLTGHSLGGALAALVGTRFHLPTISFEAPGDRLASLRLGLTSSPSNASSLPYITQIYNLIDPLAVGVCHGAFSVCAQLGYALESKCHTGRVMEFDLRGQGWQNPILTHRIEMVIAMLEDESIPIPIAVPQSSCKDCTSWKFGDYTPIGKPWWRRLLDGLFGSGDH